MQTPNQRKQLIQEGRYYELDPPEGLGQPWREPAFAPSAKARQFRTTVDEVFEREPGSDG